MKRYLFLFTMSILSVLLGKAQVVDSSFGNNGIVKGTKYPSADYVMQKPNGDLISVGSGLRNAKYILGLYQLKENGSIDSDFTKNSRLNTESMKYIPYSVAVQKDNKIVVAYRINDLFSINRYNGDGTADSTFRFQNSFPQPKISYFHIATQTDGKIIGYMGYISEEGFHTDQYLFRLNKDGSFDNSFGEQGVVSDFNQEKFGDYYYQSISVDSFNRIICAGSVLWKNNQNPSEVITSCHLPDGKIDKSFGDSGYVIIENPYKEKYGFHSGNVYLQIFSNNNILLATGYNDNAFRLALISYLPDGRLNPNFGDDGSRVHRIENGGTGINDLKISRAGRIYVATSSSFLYKASGNVYSFTRKGDLDSSFGVDGNLALQNGTINSLAVQEDEKLLVAGSSWLTFYKYFIVRYTVGEDNYYTHISSNGPSQSSQAIADDLGITIHPNPAVSILNVSGLDYASATVYILNVNGQMVAAKRVDHAKTAAIDVSNLPNGIYFLRLQQGIKTKTFRFVKQ